ncbi:hypothetical protein HDV00_004798 [Rhizophlyctis rosea]|nr:hypothetical protein HDV00_004798 [Rhizophlyctis rosea]
MPENPVGPTDMADPHDMHLKRKRFELGNSDATATKLPKLSTVSARSPLIRKVPNTLSNYGFVSTRPNSSRPPLHLKSLADKFPGLSYCPSFLTPSEQSTVLAYLDTLPWRTDLQRRTMHFGGTYCYSHHTLNRPRSPPPTIPNALSFITTRLIDLNVYPLSNPPTELTINEYIDAQGISPHIDKLHFGPTICAVSLGSASTIRFLELDLQPNERPIERKNNTAKRTGRSVEVRLDGGSLLVMSGEARWKWQHEIPRTKTGRTVGWRRVSLTYRTIGNPEDGVWGWEDGKETELGKIRWGFGGENVTDEIIVK